MTSLKIAIVHHPDRKPWCIQLIRDLVMEGFFPSDIKLVIDTDGCGARANHLRAWEWLGQQEAEYGLVLEDDVTLCEDFMSNLGRMMSWAPNQIRSLYLGRGRPPQYQERIASVIGQDTSFITASMMMSGQGYLMPISFFTDADRMEAHQLPIDEAITRWARDGEMRITYPKYSLVDHRDGPTLIEDHGDGQPRNGTTALNTADCDPSGAKLPEIRKAWLVAGHNTPWNLGSIPLPEGETP